MMIHRHGRTFVIPSPTPIAAHLAATRAERDALQHERAALERELAESRIQRERLQAMLRQMQALLRDRRRGQDMARDIERDNKQRAAELARQRAIWQAEQAERDLSLPLQ